MKNFRLFVLLFSLALGDYGVASESECPSDMKAISEVAPTLPPKLHNEFEGFALVRYKVDENGNVGEPKIIEEEWNPIGNSKGAPIGYREAIIKSVSTYKYVAQTTSCMSTKRIIVEWQ